MLYFIDIINHYDILASVTTGEACTEGVCTVFGSVCNAATGQCVCDCGRQLLTDVADNSPGSDPPGMLCASGEIQRDPQNRDVCILLTWKFSRGVIFAFLRYCLLRESYPSRKKPHMHL